MSHAEIESLPDGFDPEYYLEVNADVAAAGFDPFVHYAKYGRAEGRLYRRPFENIQPLGGAQGGRIYICGLHPQGADAVDAFLKELGSSSLGWLTEADQPSSFSIASDGPFSSIAQEQQKILESIPAGSHALGNITPDEPSIKSLRDELSIVCVHGGLKEIVAARFWADRATQPGHEKLESDLRQDFIRYLVRLGSRIVWLSTRYASYRDFFGNQSRHVLGATNFPCFVVASDFLSPAAGPILATQIANNLGCKLSQSNVKSVWSSAVATAKRKLDIAQQGDPDRCNVWTDEALQRYRDVGLERIEKSFC